MVLLNYPHLSLHGTKKIICVCVYVTLSLLMYCKMDALGIVGCGGLLQHSDRRWLTEYSRKIETYDALSAEMWRMYMGMQLAWR